MLRRLLLLSIVFVLFASTVIAAPITTDNRQRVYDAVVHLKRLSDIQTLKPLYLMITSRHGFDLLIQASQAEIDYLRKAGWKVDVTGRNDQPVDATGYHTYATCQTELEGFVTSYPSIAQLFSIGKSVENRDVWVLKISDNVVSDEAEPKLLFEFTIHGDEQIGMEVGMAWAHELLENYGTDTQITNLINDMEIYLIPMVNPDGIAHTRRTNGNYEDLNRSFPWWWEGSGAWTAEPEVEAIIDLGLSRDFVMAMDYHSGSEVVNYNWDSIYTLSPDNDVELWASNIYADQSNYDVTNGAAWYIADGSAEDWFHGAMASVSAIIEISYTKMPPEAQIQGYIDMNLPSMLDWSEIARQGIWGTVADSDTKAPVEAAVFVDSRLPSFSDADLGDFYKVLQAGTYDVKVWANGYGWTTENDVVVPSGHLDLNLSLDASADDYAAVRCVLNKRNDNSDNPANVSHPHMALGGADGVAFSLGVSGWAVFDMGENTPVTCEGNYLHIVEKETDAVDGYTVAVAEEWNGPWESLGTGTGDDYLDLSDVSFTTIRYVRIVDDGNGVNTGATPGADIDAIEVTDEAVIDDDTTDDDAVDDDAVDDDAVDDDAVDDDTADDDAVDDDAVDDDATDDDTVDDDATDDDMTDDDVTDDDMTDDDATDDDQTDDDISVDDDTSGDDDLVGDDDDDDDGCGC